MTGFGENLRREREMRSVTLQEISDTTKISVRLLEAVEKEEFSKLPGGIFTRSFIRSYANYLGLDPDQVIAEYELAAPPKGDEDFSRIGVNGNIPKKRARVLFLPWFVAVVLLVGGYTLFRYTHRATDEPVTFGSPAPVLAPSPTLPAAAASASKSKVPAVIAPTESPEAAGAALPTSGTAQPAPPPSGASIKAVSATTPGLGVIAAASLGGGAPGAAAPQGADLPAVTAAPGQLVLQIAATQRAWVAVSADGKTVLERILNPHEVRTLVAKSYFDVTTGNALGTVLTLNGVTLKPLGRSGEVKTVHLTPDSLKGATP